MANGKMTIEIRIGPHLAAMAALFNAVTPFLQDPDRDQGGCDSMEIERQALCSAVAVMAQIVKDGIGSGGEKRDIDGLLIGGDHGHE